MNPLGLIEGNEFVVVPTWTSEGVVAVDWYLEKGWIVAGFAASTAGLHVLLVRLRSSTA